jgi:glutamate decarboxylase
MEPEAELLMAECSPKNMIDKDEYPQTAELEHRCVNIIGNLWHAAHEEAVGCSTTGSSEACMLGGMALLWRWRARRRAAGKDTARPNLVMGSNVQVCWEKFCRYWDVEPKYVPLERGRYHLGVPEAVALCDENTIGVVAIMGSTMDGSYEPVADLAAALDALAATPGDPDVPIHVDAASGGFVAPFLQPDTEWDFRLKRVASINASGHKYGLVYPGVGWVIWRDQDHLPEDLIFKVNYLGGEMPTFALNFSRPGAQVAAQYYNFLRLGFSGYRHVQQTSQDIARYLSGEIAKLGPFELLSDGSDLPVFAFKLRDDVDKYSVFDISERLRMRGWQVPAYTFPENLTDMAVMRMVIRNGFSMDLAGLLLNDLRAHLRILEHNPQTQMPPELQKKRESFAH